jgi:RNA polymerase sigma-70 factor (ECF subfamily)
MVRGESDDLVARARQGDQDAWAILYADTAQRLVVWLSHLPHLDPASDPEDVAGEAWLTAARRIADFTGDRGDFAGWLFGIARNIALARHRTTNRRATSATDPALMDATLGGSLSDPALKIAAADATRRLIAELPEREAQVVACIDVVGLDVASTGVALGMSSTAVRVAHHRGLGRLRKILLRRDKNFPRTV